MSVDIDHSGVERENREIKRAEREEQSGGVKRETGHSQRERERALLG